MNNLIPPPKVLGVFLTVIAIEWDSFTGRSIEELIEEFEGVQGFKDSRSTKFKGYLKFGGVFTYGLKN